MAYNHGSPERHTGNPLPELAHQFPGPCSVDLAAHHPKNLVRDVLQRDIEILADLGVGRHLIEHILREISGIGIMDTYPLNPIHSGEPAYQLG